MKRIFALIIFCSLFSATTMFGQQGNTLSIQWDMSFATGDLGNYISAPSFRGASFTYRNAVTDYIRVGADIGWNVFYEKMDYESYTSGTQTLTGIQYRYQNQVPILVSLDYIFAPTSTVQPYVGLGIGTMYTERYTAMGTWYVKENPWQFAIKPEAGLLYEFSDATAFKLGLKYMTGIGGDIGTQGYFTVSLGFAFNL